MTTVSLKACCKSLLDSKPLSHSGEARCLIQNRAQLLSKTKHFVRRASGWPLYLSLTNPKIQNPKSKTPKPAKPGDVTRRTPGLHLACCLQFTSACVGLLPVITTLNRKRHSWQTSGIGDVCYCHLPTPKFVWPAVRVREGCTVSSC